MPGEFDFLRWIQAQPCAGPLVRRGPGDDLAVLNWPAGELLLIGTDQVLDGVHFDSAVHSAEQIGRKAMNRNLSDCAAMAALPAAAVATVALPKGTSLEYAQQLYLGLSRAGAAFDCPLVGGDTGTWAGKLAITVCILGRSAGVEPILRSGAKIGDGIFVTGALGGSLLGRHMNFVPRVAEARALAAAVPISAMIDLSDGLSRDLSHICRQSGVGAVVEAQHVPIHADAIELSRRDGRQPLEHALHDGEDYELVFTTAATPPPSAVRIGRIVAGSKMLLDRDGKQQILEPRGWEHAL